MAETVNKDTSSIVKKWYVVRAISGQEKKVKQYIEVEINRLKLNDYVSQVLIPTEKYIQIRNGKKIQKERSFYPGYVLIEAALVGEITHTIKNITGVIGFLGETKRGEAVPMRLSEVNRILGTVDDLTEAESTVTSNYIVGEAVKVINVLLLFGGKKIPELMKGLGKGMKEFKDAKDGNSESTDVEKK